MDFNHFTDYKRQYHASQIHILFPGLSVWRRVILKLFCVETHHTSSWFSSYTCLLLLSVTHISFFSNKNKNICQQLILTNYQISSSFACAVPLLRYWHYLLFSPLQKYLLSTLLPLFITRITHSSRYLNC